MDFLSQVSLRFVDEVVESDEDNDTGRRKVFLLSNHMARPVFQHDQIDLPMTQGIAGIAVKYHFYTAYIFPSLRGQPHVYAFETQLHCPRESGGIDGFNAIIIRFEC